VTIFKTEQEKFWAEKFGEDYIGRNQGSQMLAGNISLFSKALSRSVKPKSCIEFGANIGLNLKALQLLYPGQEQYAIEINQKAVEKLQDIIPSDHICHDSILEFNPCRTWDLVLIKGVLIHINPDYLNQVYHLLHKSSSRYSLICEYYNPSPVSISYRGHTERLFKRDFCGEILDAYPDLRLIDYGFCYRRDTNFSQDDITWFLVEKEI
jgi:pseudaminic acid biosynthesis-associated methylase